MTRWHLADGSDVEVLVTRIELEKPARSRKTRRTQPMLWSCASFWFAPSRRFGRTSSPLHSAVLCGHITRKRQMPANSHSRSRVFADSPIPHTCRLLKLLQRPGDGHATAADGKWHTPGSISRESGRGTPETRLATLGDARRASGIPPGDEGRSDGSEREDPIHEQVPDDGKGHWRR